MGGRVLIVDDDWLNIEMMEAHLEAEYEIDSVNSGERALERVRQMPPDVILMDVRMGGMDGYAATAALKSDEATCHIPVLLVTGFNTKDDIKRAVQAGVDDILFKPIATPLMLLRVKTLMRLKQLHDQLNV